MSSWEAEVKRNVDEILPPTLNANDEIHNSIYRFGTKVEGLEIQLRHHEAELEALDRKVHYHLYIKCVWVFLL